MCNNQYYEGENLQLEARNKPKIFSGGGRITKNANQSY